MKTYQSEAMGCVKTVAEDRETLEDLANPHTEVTAKKAKVAHCFQRVAKSQDEQYIQACLVACCSLTVNARSTVLFEFCHKHTSRKERGNYFVAAKYNCITAQRKIKMEENSLANPELGEGGTSRSKTLGEGPGK